MIAANQVFLRLPDQEDAIWGADEKDPVPDAKKEEAKSVVLTKKVEHKGFQTVVWEASDENGDDLAYDIFIRKEGEKEWRVLQENRREPVYAFDTLSFADGTYFIKVRAIDGPSNPEGQELSAERIGPAFVIDNSTPLIKGFTAAKVSGGYEIAFQTEDAFSYIEEVKVPDSARGLAGGVPDGRHVRFADGELQVHIEDSLRRRRPDQYPDTGQLREYRRLQAAAVKLHGLTSIGAVHFRPVPQRMRCSIAGTVEQYAIRCSLSLPGLTSEDFRAGD